MPDDGTSAVCRNAVRVTRLRLGRLGQRDTAGRQRLVDTNGTRRICWRPDLSWTGHSIADEIVTAKVTAWTQDDPPDYLVVACPVALKF